MGEALRRTLAPLGEIVIPTLAELDLTDTQATLKMIREVRPRWVVNAAAHTAVDKAESEPELAFAIKCDRTFLRCWPRRRGRLAR